MDLDFYQKLLVENIENDNLYIHIPFCANICNYCDFAKTADFDQNIVNIYLNKIKSHVDFWNDLHCSQKGDKKISTIYFGGGTPSLFDDQYFTLKDSLDKRLADNYEWTIECNPNDICEKKLRCWKELGINRLSIGVQSFNDTHLGFLSRDHNSIKAKEAINLANNYFDKINVDLIYGICFQSYQDLIDDILWLVDHNIGHLSLYHLTFEPNTPLYRAYKNNKITDHSIQNSKEFYRLITDLLSHHGYFHEELANFALKGESCRHNWAYWMSACYIGIGAGAHGYYVDYQSNKELDCLKYYGGDNDIRYSFGKNHHHFNKIHHKHYKDISDFLSTNNAVVDYRKAQQKLWEVVSSSMRTSAGIAIDAIATNYDIDFNLDKLKNVKNDLSFAFDQGLIKYDHHRLYFHPSLWLFSHHYFHQLIDLFDYNSNCSNEL